MSATIPPLRPDIRLEPAPADAAYAVTLVDDALGQRMRLDERGAQVAGLLDCEQGLDALATRMGAEPAAAERVVKVFARLHLLDTEDSRQFVVDASSTGSWQGMAASNVPFLVRDDAAFSCSMCGGCCGGHNVGPVFPDVAEGIRAILDELPLAAERLKGGLTTLPVGPNAEGGQVICHSRNGSCVFLNEDRLCSIHAAFGAEKKPRVCRLFPYEFIATPDGVAVSISSECRGLAATRNGTPLGEQTEAIQKLFQLVPALRQVRPVLMVDAQTPLAYSDYRVLEERMHTVVDQEPSAAGVLRAFRAMTNEVRGASEHTVAGDDVAARFQGFLTNVLRMIDGLRSVFEQDFDDVLVRTSGLDALEAAVQTLATRLVDVVRPFRVDSQRALYRDRFHHFLHGKQLTTARTVVSGQARLALHWFLSRALIIARAQQVKRVHCVDQDVVDAIAVIAFEMRNQAVSQGLNVFEEDIVALFFDELPVLIDQAESMTPVDARLELHKF